MSSMQQVVVVGGGLAAARTCEQLRVQGFTGRITMISEEERLPYDRPPLSKDVLTGAKDDTTLPYDYESLGVEVRLETPATGLCVTDRTVSTADGELPYDGLVIATGRKAVRVNGTGRQLTMRTHRDATTLRDALMPGARVVVIGAGWIGSEVAGTALRAGCDVSCIEAAPTPLHGALGPDIGARVLPWWDGVDLRLNTYVDAVSAEGVQLLDGDLLRADIVITGIGSRPDTEWLQGSELTLDGGVVVDGWLRAAPGVVAVGDVAASWSRRLNRHARVEHWDNAASGPRVAAAALLHPNLADVAEHDPVAYFWSDQLGHKLQFIGTVNAGDELLWREYPSGAWAALWVGENDQLNAALVADLPREFVQARLAVCSDARIDRNTLRDPAAQMRGLVLTK